MNDVEGTWDEGLQDAWRGFRHDLVARIAALGWETFLFVVPTAGYECDEMLFPDLAVSRFGDLLRCDFMRPDVEVNDSDSLNDIGFDLDEDDDLRRFETDDAEWLAVTIVRVLREVTGVVHPSFVTLWGPEPGADPKCDPLALVFPEDRDDLVETVDAILTEVIGQAPSKDEDGDVPIVCGESVVFVRVRHDLAVVEVFSEVVVDVANTQAALFELNILNRDSPGPTFALRGDRVVVRSRISGNPILPAELRRVVDAMCATVDQTARDLVARIGGHTFLGEPPAKTDERKSPGREAIRTLRHLEEDEPGSVSPVLAAHIFHLDQEAILDQIARQRRAGRNDLVGLLRRALRVVVEREVDQGSLA